MMYGLILSAFLCMLSLCFQISRIERSLSPMDLSPPSSPESPPHSPLPSPNKKSTPELSESYQSPKNSPLLTSFSPKPNGVVSLFATSVVDSPQVKLLTTSTQVCKTLEPRETPQASNNTPMDEISSPVTQHNPPPAKLEAATSVPISSQISTSKPTTISIFEDSQPLPVTSETSNSTQDEVSSTIAPPKPRVMKGATRSITLSDLFVKATSSVSGFSHIDIQPAVESPEVGNKMLNGRVTPQKSVRKLSPSQLASFNESL
jgi:hypothetical protein